MHYQVHNMFSFLKQKLLINKDIFGFMLQERGQSLGEQECARGGAIRPRLLLFIRQPSQEGKI
jgi:hypothetical protein